MGTSPFEGVFSGACAWASNAPKRGENPAEKALKALPETWPDNIFCTPDFEQISAAIQALNPRQQGQARPA
ncbi:hypothetical protein ACP90_07825 [Labrenzia sp. CP4]|uniref:hypothetical protein n=1 Tax=Roseibium algicola TaxID=2857014 RepID=UPI000785358E|nr:hypothetical protein ACP90_07825 [Labrenzia sp. CP4]MBO9459988.1 hypothetical protein [Labrenzia sp. R5_0]